MDPFLLGLTIVAIFILFYLLSGRSATPMQWLGKGMVHLTIGVFLLFFANLFGGYIGLYIPYNEATLAIASLLGVPGVLGLAAIQWWIIP